MWTWIWFIAFVGALGKYFLLYKKLLNNDKKMEKHNKITQLTILAALASCGDEVKSGDAVNSYIANLEILLKREDFLDLINSLLRSRNMSTISTVSDMKDEQAVASIIALRNSIAENLVQTWNYLDDPGDRKPLY